LFGNGASLLKENLEEDLSKNSRSYALEVWLV
jgi:hypothetical protein